MLKRFTVSLLVLSLLASFGFAQSKKMVVQHAQKVTAVSKANAKNFVSSSKSLNKTAAASQLISTEYDYAGNNSIPDMLDMYDFTGDQILDVVAVAMQRFDAVAASREVRMIVGNPTDGFADFPISASASGAGWGSVQVATAGPLDGNALSTYHQGGKTWLTKVDLTDPNLTVTMSDSGLFAGNFPSFVYKDDGTFYATNANGGLYTSTDNGASFNFTGVYLDPDDPAITDYNSEYLLKKSQNGQYIFHPGAWTVAGNGGPGGVPDDSTDYVGINYSTDGGANWNFEIIGRDGITPVANRPGYYPLFENFGQINGAVDNNGVMHVTMNGYSFWNRTTDTTFAFPAIYWNSRDKQWLAVSDTAVEHTIYQTGTYDRPGNGLGNAYATPVISPDGNNIVVLYQGPEYAGTPGVGEPNVWTPTTDDPNELHYCDLYYAVSNDGGVTWGTPALVPDASAQMVQESFPAPAHWLYADGDNGVVNLLFMIDEIPGTSLFADNNSGTNNSTWNYTSFTVPMVVGVDDADYTVNGFKLEQNYPNPFNPSTLIKFNISERSNVSLKVFDMLGREVANLMNEVKDANSYEVNFNASNLASGLYIYKLQAGNFAASKKMMLLK